MNIMYTLTRFLCITIAHTVNVFHFNNNKLDTIDVVFVKDAKYTIL